MTVHESELSDPAPARAGRRRRGLVEVLAETLGTGVGNTVAFMADYGILFAVFAVIWVAFGAALIWSQGSVDAAWQAIRDLPLLIEGLVWLLFLPVMVALWIWETSWPVALRLLLVISIGAWNLFIFLPRALMAKP